MKWISIKLNFEVHYNKYVFMTPLKSKGKNVFIISQHFVPLRSLNLHIDHLHNERDFKTLTQVLL